MLRQKKSSFSAGGQASRLSRASYGKTTVRSDLFPSESRCSGRSLALPLLVPLTPGSGTKSLSRSYARKFATLLFGQKLSKSSVKGSPGERTLAQASSLCHRHCA
jgi:hypothetical protein